MEERLQVLVLDDEPIVGRRIKPALEKYGVDVEVFEDPHLAKERMTQKHFDVVITDMRMHSLDGMQMLDHVLSTGGKTKVILITGYATMDLAQRALAKGAFEFIAKPFRTDQLRAAVHKAAESLSRPGLRESRET